MSFWEKFAIGFLGAAEAALPIFIHSSRGVIILNASESVVNEALSSAVANSAQPPVQNPTPITVSVTTQEPAPTKEAA